MKIFVSKQAGIGDVVLTTPLLAALKKRYPTSKITLMVFPNALQAVDQLPFIDEVFCYDKKKDSVWEVLRRIWRSDLALCLDLQYRPAMLSFFAGAKVRAGLAHKRKFWLNHSIPWEEYMDHIYEPYALGDILFKTTGIELPRSELATIYFSVPPKQVEQDVTKLLLDRGLAPGSPYLACSPVTAFHLKNWQTKNWQALFTRIYKEFSIPVVFFGSSTPGESLECAGAINLCEKTTLIQAAALIKNSTMLVNSCSLPVHIAAAFKKPTVILYGYGDPNRWAPREDCTVVSAELDCSPCDGYIGTTCTDPRCMRAITVDMVYAACAKKLQTLTRNEALS